MVRNRRSAGLALLGLAIGLSLSSAASAAGNLECIDAGYQAKDAAATEGFLADFSIAQFKGDSGMEKLVPAFAAHAGECAEKHGWSVEAITDSVFYRTATVLSQALVRHTPFTAEQMKRLETALERADKARLRKIFGPMIEAQAGGQAAAAPEPDNQDSVYLGMLLMSAGVPLDEKGGEFAGALIASRMMREIYAEKFATR